MERTCICADCKRVRDRSAYSKRQWKRKNDNLARCSECVTFGQEGCIEIKNTCQGKAKHLRFSEAVVEDGINGASKSRCSEYVAFGQAGGSTEIKNNNGQGKAKHLHFSEAAVENGINGASNSTTSVSNTITCDTSNFCGNSSSSCSSSTCSSSSSCIYLGTSSSSNSPSSNNYLQSNVDETTNDKSKKSPVELESIKIVKNRNPKAVGKKDKSVSSASLQPVNEQGHGVVQSKETKKISKKKHGKDDSNLDISSHSTAKRSKIQTCNRSISDSPNNSFSGFSSSRTSSSSKSLKGNADETTNEKSKKRPMELESMNFRPKLGKSDSSTSLQAGSEQGRGVVQSKETKKPRKKKHRKDESKVSPSSPSSAKRSTIQTAYRPVSDSLSKNSSHSSSTSSSSKSLKGNIDEKTNEKSKKSPTEVESINTMKRQNPKASRKQGDSDSGVSLQPGSEQGHEVVQSKETKKISKKNPDLKMSSSFPQSSKRSKIQTYNRQAFESPSNNSSRSSRGSPHSNSFNNTVDEANDELSEKSPTELGSIHIVTEQNPNYSRKQGKSDSKTSQKPGNEQGHDIVQSEDTKTTSSNDHEKGVESPGNGASASGVRESCENSQLDVQGKDDLRREVICSICHEVLDRPVSLQCGHSFCSPCLNGFLNGDSARNRFNNQRLPQPKKCPNCRHGIHFESRKCFEEQFGINTALQACILAMFPEDIDDRQQAERRAKKLAMAGENSGQHSRGFELIQPINDELFEPIASNLSGRRSIVLDSEDQTMQLCLALTRKPVIRNQILSAQLCLLHMEEDEAEAGVPLVIKSEDDEALISTTEFTLQTTIEATNMMTNDDEEIHSKPFTKQKMGENGVVSFSINLIQNNISEGHHIRFCHIETKALFDINFKCSNNDIRARDRRARRTLPDESASRIASNSDEESVGEYEEDGFVVSDDVVEYESDNNNDFREEATESDDDNDLCFICKDVGHLMVCYGGEIAKGCEHAFHTECIGRDCVPDCDWICQSCAAKIGRHVGIEGLELVPGETKSAARKKKIIGKRKRQEQEECETDDETTWDGTEDVGNSPNNRAKKRRTISESDDEE